MIPPVDSATGKFDVIVAMSPNADDDALSVPSIRDWVLYSDMCTQP